MSVKLNMTKALLNDSIIPIFNRKDYNESETTKRQYNSDTLQINKFNFYKNQVKISVKLKIIKALLNGSMIRRSNRKD